MQRKDQSRNRELYRRVDESSAPLVRDAILGSKEALGELCLLYKPLFWGYIRRYLTSKHLPLSRGEDLLQDTFESVIKSFNYYDPRPGNIGPLMYVIVKAVCIGDSKLKENKRRDVPLHSEEDSDGDEWSVTDGAVATAWMSENSPGHVESPPPLQNPKGDGGGRPRLNKPKAKKARARRLSEDEMQRRGKIRQEWAADENQAVRMVDAKM